MAQLKGMVVEIDYILVKEKQHESEYQAVKVKGYKEGFHGYLKGFLVVEPNFDWSNLGPDILKWMDEFKTLEVEGITAKKVDHEANMANKACPDANVKDVPNTTSAATVEEVLKKAKEGLPTNEENAPSAS